MIQAINEAFDRLRDETKNYYQKQIRRVETKFVFEAAYQTGMKEGEIAGRNEDERMGMMRDLWPQLVEDYEKARLAELHAEMTYKLAMLEKERMEQLVESNEGLSLLNPQGGKE